MNFKPIPELVIQLSERTEKVDHTKIARSIGERVKTLEEFGKTYNGVSNARASVGKISGSPETKEQKSTLTKVGTALILIPDPFIIPDAVGLGLVAAGFLESKFKKKPLTLYETKKEFANTIRELQKLRSTI